jgi:hypothetical protein
MESSTPPLLGSNTAEGPEYGAGALGRDRTCDQLLRRQLLYPLSYEGICAMLSAWLSEDPVGESPRLVTGHRLNRASRESVTPRPV